MKDFLSEISYKTARSSGAGGQNVNKVETMVTAKWLVNSTFFFDELEKERISEKLKNKINSEGYLQLSSQEARSQLENKELVTKKMLKIVNDALFVPKARKNSKPTKASKLRRLDAKKIISEKKQNRKFKF